MCDARAVDVTPIRPEKRGNFGKRMNRNIVKKLQQREIHRHGSCFDLLPNVPPRLKFRLCDLIRESIQRFGHIFLGFTKDGHHVLSYSMQMDLYLPPTFNYRLYWWRFKPHQPLKKVAEVKIFGEEDISSDLLINVCQWPSDDSKLVIYGVNQESRGHQGPCYLTIAANPPLDSCDGCKESCRRLHGGSDESANDVNDQVWENGGSPLCLHHGFVLHLQFNLVPPFPEFNPFVSLQRDGQVVINTGDSIVALSVSTEVKIQSNECAANSPIEMEQDAGCASSSPSSSKTSSPVSARQSDDSPFEWVQFGNVTLGKSKTDESSDISKMAPPSSAAIMECELVRLVDTSQAEMATMESSSSVDVSSNASQPFGQIQRHNVCSKDEEFLQSDSGGYDLRTPAMTPTSSSSVTTSGIATNFEVLMYSLKQTTDEYIGGPPCRNSGLNLGGGGGDHGESLNSDKESVKENVAPDYLELYRIQQQQGLKEGGLQSRGCNRFDVALLSSPLPSPPSPPDALRFQQPSCVMRVKRVFVPQRDVGANDDAEEEDDVGNWVYHGSLPLEVHWPSGTPLVPCPRSLLDEVTGPTLVARQAIFDVEQYLHEMAEQLCAEAGKKFLVFDDYDIEIVDVLSETSDVIVLATMIIQATPKNDLTKSQRNISLSLRKQYETGFTFVWSVETGKYEVVDTETFKEVDVSKVKRGVQRGWNPGKKQCADLQTKWRILRCRFNEVTVLTNETIFTGVSLKEILSPSGDVAIVL